MTPKRALEIIAAVEAMSIASSSDREAALDQHLEPGEVEEVAFAQARLGHCRFDTLKVLSGGFVPHDVGMRGQGDPSGAQEAIAQG